MSGPWDDAVARLGMALLHFVWQGALVGCVAALGLVLLRNARPQARYAFCGAALLLCLLLPMWQVLTPAAPPAPALALAVSMPIPADPVAVVPAGRAQGLSASTLRPGLPTVVLIWSLGAALMALRLALGLVGVQRLCAAAAHPLDPAWPVRLATLARRMDLRQVPRLRAIEGLDGPVVVGRWRPLILVPASLLMHMPAELLEALLAHELAHVRRLDYLANLLQSVVEVLLFYHPVVWWLSQRIRTEREQIADDLAAHALGEPRRLALALSELARLQSSRPAFAPLALAAQGGNLMTRITRLVRPARQPLGGKLLLPLAGLAALAIAAHAASVPAPATPAAPATTPVPPTPVASTAPAKKSTHTISLGDAKQPFAYALVSAKDGSTTMSGNDKDLREAHARRAGIAGDFLWVRQGTQRYVVTDPAALAQVQAVWAPVHAFDAEMEKLDAQMDAQSEVAERMAHDIEKAHKAPSAELEALSKQMSQLTKQREKAQAEIDKLSRRMATTRDEKKLAQMEQQQERLEQALEPLDESIDALSEQMDRISDALEQAVEQAQGKQEQEAEQAMERLSSQMEALSERQEAASQAAEQQLRALVQDFVKRGLAKPA